MLCCVKTDESTCNKECASKICQRSNGRWDSDKNQNIPYICEIGMKGDVWYEIRLHLRNRYRINKYLQVITFVLHENIFYLLDLAQENGCVHYKLFPISGISNVPMDQIDAFCKEEMVDEEFGGLANWDGKSNFF